MKPLISKKILFVSLLSLGSLWLISVASRSPTEPEGYKDPPGGGKVDPDLGDARSTETPQDDAADETTTERTPSDPEGYKDPPGEKPEPNGPAVLA